MIDVPSSGTSVAKKIGIGLVVLAVLGIAGTVYNGHHSDSISMAVKSGNVEFDLNGRLKLFDAESKYFLWSSKRRI